MNTITRRHLLLSHKQVVSDMHYLIDNIFVRLICHPSAPMMVLRPSGDAHPSARMMVLIPSGDAHPSAPIMVLRPSGDATRMSEL